MNTLRIMPMAFSCGFRPSGHKEPRATKLTKWLITLLLLWPALASAACLPSQVCVATSGTTVATSSDSSVPFNFAGNGFSASGVLADYGNLSDPNFFGEEFEAGSPADILMGGTPPPNGTLVQFALTVNGVPWGIPEAGGDAFVFFDARVVIPEFFNTSCCMAPFVFDGSFTGAPEPFLPGLGCDVLNCETLNFHGTGIVTFAGHTVEDPSDPDNPFIFFFDQVTWKLAATPEPPPSALLLLGFAGLAVMGLRRRSLTTTIQAG